MDVYDWRGFPRLSEGTLLLIGENSSLRQTGKKQLPSAQIDKEIDEIVTEVRRNRLKLLEMYGGIEGLQKHMKEECPLLKKRRLELHICRRV